MKEILAESREGLARVGTIVADLLRMSRQGDGERDACDLGDIVRGVLPLVSRGCSVTAFAAPTGRPGPSTCTA